MINLFDFSPLVLEPDFDLILVELQLARQILAPLLGQIAILAKFRFETGQLIGSEGRAWTLLLGFASIAHRATAAPTAALFLPNASRPWTYTFRTHTHTHTHTHARLINIEVPLIALKHLKESERWGKNGKGRGGTGEEFQKIAENQSREML